MLTFLIHRLDALLGHLYRISEFGESRCRVGRAMRRIQVLGGDDRADRFLGLRDPGRTRSQGDRVGAR